MLESPLTLCSLARHGAEGGGSVSHGDSGFRCRKGGSEGGERGEEAPLVYSPKNDRGGVYPPRLSCPSYPSHLPQFTFRTKTLKFLIIKRRGGGDWAGEMAQWIKAFASKLPGAHKVEGETRLPWIVL